MENIPAPPLLIHGPRPKQGTIDAARYVMEGGWPIRQAAKKFGVSPAVVRNRIRGLREGRNIYREAS